MSARLYVLSGADAGRSFALEEGATIGRSPECAVTLRDPSVSRVHARVERRERGLALVDQDSRNGLWRRGARVQELALADLEELKLGDVLVRVRLGAGDAPAEVEPAPLSARVESPKPRASLELEEIVLEEPPSAPPPVAAHAPARGPARVPEPRAAPEPASLGATRVSAGLESRGQRVLQYHKTASGGGWLSTELEQRPPWVKALLFLVALAIAVGVGWLAYSATSFLRERAGGAADDAPAE